jgi:hypothetical protein
MYFNANARSCSIDHFAGSTRSDVDNFQRSFSALCAPRCAEPNAMRWAAIVRPVGAEFVAAKILLGDSKIA